MGSQFPDKQAKQLLVFCLLLASIQLLVPLLSRHHIPTNSVAPFSAYKHTHTTLNSFIRSDEGLTFETRAFKLFTVANFRYQLS